MDFDYVFFICCAASVLWVGLAVHFVQNWRARRNPISLGLAFCFVVCATWAPSWWYFTRTVDPASLMLGGAITQASLATVLHGCVWLAKHKFPGSRPDEDVTKSE